MDQLGPLVEHQFPVGAVALLAGLVLDLVYATGILASAARWRMYAPLKQMSWHHPLNKC